jgi:hypothetical protein
MLYANPKAEADNIDKGMNNSGYPAKTEFDNCFIIHCMI